jgi:uncharacterized protein (TIGR02271 family)
MNLHIPLAEEQIDVSVEQRTTGRIRVSTDTHVVEEMATATLEHLDVLVKRIPINQVVDVAPAVRVDGDTTIVPVLEEVLFVEKRLVLKAEIHIARSRTHETVQMPVTLRRQEATVERIDDQSETTK